MTWDVKAALKEFVAEAEELLEQLSSDAEQFETSLEGGSIPPDLVNKIFREFHSLKGLAGMLELKSINELSHLLEETLDKLRMGQFQADHRMYEIILSGLETLRKLVSEVSEKGQEESGIDDLKEKIERFSMSSQQGSVIDPLEYLEIGENDLRALTEYEEHRLTENLKERKDIYSVVVKLEFDSFDSVLRELTKDLSNVGEIISTLPITDTDQSSLICFNLLLGSSSPKEELEKLTGAIPAEVKCITKKKIAEQPKVKRTEPAKGSTTTTPIIDTLSKYFIYSPHCLSFSRIFLSRAIARC